MQHRKRLLRYHRRKIRSPHPLGHRQGIQTFNHQRIPGQPKTVHQNPDNCLQLLDSRQNRRLQQQLLLRFSRLHLPILPDWQTTIKNIGSSISELPMFLFLRLAQRRIVTYKITPSSELANYYIIDKIGLEESHSPIY